VEGEDLDSQLHLTCSRKEFNSCKSLFQVLSAAYGSGSGSPRLTAVLLGQQRLHVQLHGAAASPLTLSCSVEVERPAVGWLQSPDGAPGGGVQLWEVGGQPLPDQEDVEVPHSR